MSEESVENPTVVKRDNVRANPVNNVKQHEVQSNPVEHEENDDTQSDASDEVVSHQVSVWNRWFGWTSQDYWVGVAVGSAAVVLGLSVRSFIRNRY